MDLEGTWNPPEEWPETSPPLPGWVRGDGGSWHEPSDPIESSTGIGPALLDRLDRNETDANSRHAPTLSDAQYRSGPLPPAVRTCP